MNFSVVKSINVLFSMQILQHWEMWQVLGGVMYQMDKLLHPLVDCMVLWTSHQGHPLAPPGCHRLLKMEMKVCNQIVLKVETWGMTMATPSVTCLVSPLTSGMVLWSVPPEQLVTIVKYHFPLQMQWIFRYGRVYSRHWMSHIGLFFFHVVDKWKFMFPGCRFWISKSWSDPPFESA